MASSEQKQAEEQTFRNYAPSQAKKYAVNRGSYHENLFKVILEHHESTGGTFGTLLDVGCGPGNSTRPLAKHFATAYGIDPSLGMIDAAKGISAEAGEAETAMGKPIEFIEGKAEDMYGPLRDQGRKVDLLTAGVAAHWFDMQRFWNSAAQVLHKGGTVALWGSASQFCHPSIPNAARVQKALFKLKREDLAPYEHPGSRLARDGYDSLPLPWSFDPPIEGFSRDGFTRHDWDRNEVLSDGEHFFLGDHHVTLAQYQEMFSTGSMVTRWREAHPQLAGTDEDVVVKGFRRIGEALGGDELIVGVSCSLLLLKRD